MRYHDDINTEHKKRSICCVTVAQKTKRQTHNEYTRVRNWKSANILLLQYVWLMTSARILMQKHFFSMWAESKDASKSEGFSMKGISMQKL